MNLDELLNQMVAAEASDCYLTVGASPSALVHGQLRTLSDEILNDADVEAVLAQCVNESARAYFHEHKELNIAYANAAHRFRLNVFQQRGHMGCVFRHIKTDIPSLESLGVPAVCESLIMQERGLVLITGSTGSGKSTTMAALIHARNQSRSGHMVLIEDPIEFIHRHGQSVITQREVGIDTESYAAALKNTLRQAPDVIVIGEIRDRETMEYAINFAETGHLCISTLHANNANQALDRILNFFPQERHQQLLLDLSLNLKGIVSQRLVPTNTGKRALCAEVMLATPLVSDLIRKGEIEQLKTAMQKSETSGMQTFDDALYNLVVSGQVDAAVALQQADSENNLRLRLKLGQAGSSGQSDFKLKE